MNREGAETYLRLLAERQLRGPVSPETPVPGLAWPGPGGSAAMMTVGQALTVVRALDEATVETIVADFGFALSVRPRPGRSAPAAGGAQARPGRMRFARTGPMIRAGVRPHPWAGGSLTGAAGPARSGPGGAGEPGRPGPGAPGRFVPLGVRIAFRDEELSGEVFLLSFAHTGAGARFTIAWRAHWLFDSQSVYPGMLPFGAFTVTDDRGGRYFLEFAGSDGPDWSGDVELRPAPPGDLRWLDIRGPGGPSVRVSLDPDGSADGFPLDAAEPRVSPRAVSPGEQLLMLWAERLLTAAQDIPPERRRQLPSVSPGSLPAVTAGLGEVVTALEAAGVLSPLSEVPGQVAAVCAGVGVSGHGITAPPARDLPEPWLGLLAHYQRRKPDTTPVYDGYAAVATVLPELDGIRLAVLGLLNTDGSSWVKLLAWGPEPDRLPGPQGIDDHFPLSFWIRDNGGRWHAGRPAGVHPAHGEWAVKLQLVPPLARSTTSIEVLAAGRSAQVRVRLPLRWGYPP